MQSPSHEGGCRCGQLRIRVSAPTLITMACHCTGCQRMTASAFSLGAFFPRESFQVVKGEPVIGGLHGSPLHYFCPYCMSWVFSQSVRLEQFVNVRSTMLDDAKSYPPFFETYTNEKLPWATTPAVHSFERFPPMEQLPALLAEYAAQSK